MSTDNQDQSDRPATEVADEIGPYDGKGMLSLLPMSIGGSMLALALVALAVSITGCTDEERISRLQNQADQVRDSLEQVIEKQQALRKESEQRSEQLSQANRLITEVVAQLTELSREEEELRQVFDEARPDTGNVRTVELTPGAERVEEAVKSGLSDVETQLQESRAALNRLEEEREELSGQISNFENWTTQLRERLDEREATVAQLRGEVNSLVKKLNRAREENAQLQHANAALRSSNEDLRRAYVVTAEGDSLARMGILDKPLLGFLGDAEVKQLDRSKFRSIEMGTTEIALPADRKGVEVHSPHKLDPGLYEVDEDRLVIQDPDEFWTVSRFLVVEVNR